ncbi:MAG: LON peptidase substrate-binding domain-containing protein [Pseudomonas sp.]
MLPLFPLNVVLFPGSVLDLQIFEARYLDMISGCMKRGEGFGVVTIVEGAEVGDTPFYSVYGCEAVIRDWKQQANGLLGIRVEGARRFTVHSGEVQSDLLAMGNIAWCTEMDELPLLPEHADLDALLMALSQHPMVEELGMGRPAAGQQDLSYRLAYLLPFDNDQKLKILRVDDPLERLDYLQFLLDKLQGEMTA